MGLSVGIMIFSVSIKLHFNLLIDKEDVMHFCIKIKDRAFHSNTLILNGFDILFGKDLLNPCLCYCFKSWESCFLRMRLNVFV